MGQNKSSSATIMAYPFIQFTKIKIDEPNIESSGQGVEQRRQVLFRSFSVATLSTSTKRIKRYYQAS